MGYFSSDLHPIEYLAPIPETYGYEVGIHRGEIDLELHGVYLLLCVTLF